MVKLQKLRPLSSREALPSPCARNLELGVTKNQMAVVPIAGASIPPSTFSAGAGRASPSSSSSPSLWFQQSHHRQILWRCFHHEPSSSSSSRHCNSTAFLISDESAHLDYRPVIDRRQILLSSIGMLTAAAFGSISVDRRVAMASEFADMPALKGKDYGKTKMRYPDYTETSSGLQYKDLRSGSGPIPKMGETVVVDWDGYTIGYYGRIFEARNKTKGGSFEGGDKSFYRFRLGSHEVIPAFEEAVSGMALGGIRRIIVPPDLGYPENDYNKSGPRPTTFSGQRALDFVLRNEGLIDKTLLFDIELLNIISN